MLDQLESSLNYHQQALGLRQARHEVLSANIANADTPNYKARDIDFASELKKAVDAGQQGQSGNSGGLTLSRTSEHHLMGQGPATNTATDTDLLYRIPSQPSLDGNTVEMDRERAQFADNAVRYQAALTIMNSRIQGLKTAMQPE
ncbi:flagellar basal body rod protein FlgB [Halomonas sp. CUBES01]|uniref:Flagellar basal body rod protein FlgB n=1 Tax=Vreelandella gomseomensis TaxID=370766 RepID=A0ABU1GCV1_9GAMM|nr:MULTISPECIES: flagellar basal body rod protein FlgB [Halomonas]MDR5875301.1 flagellar basal body rod protein FlgB [Halomonas gomseomensis]MEC4765836.1 flagellar basal body rod protein FlgB [Halomonas sp. CUBES01]